MKKRAFTLAELVVVISILGVIALLFVANFANIGGIDIDAASWKVQSDIRYAHQLAISTRRMHGVIFQQGGPYTVYDGTVATPVTDPETRATMVIDLERFGDIGAANNFNVEFDSIGRPTKGGGGYVELESGDGSSRRIYVVNNTGAVIVDVLNMGGGCGCEVCGKGVDNFLNLK